MQKNGLVKKTNVYWVINFEINLIFLIKPFFLHDQTVKTKFKYLENEKSF